MQTVIYGAPDASGTAELNAVTIHERMFSVALKERPSSVLEIGAGQGRLGARFAGQGIRYVGLEPVASEIEIARHNYPELTVIQASCYDDPQALGLGKFDMVYSNDVIEHLYEPRRLVNFCATHLNSGGIIVCGTPHYGSYLRNLLLSLTNRWDHHHNPLWDGGHIKFFSKASLHQVWAEGGFTNFTWGEIPSSRLRIMPMYLYCTATLSPVRS
ncbi:MAG TPA: class I SAM-dependent methyltransferase [Terracidiphilus sp.]|jgi:SAM-dependent methyltransferase